MRDQGGSFALTDTLFAGQRLGPGTALIDEDVLRVLLLDAPTGEKSLQVRYDSIHDVVIDADSVVITFRDGRGLVGSTEEAPDFREHLLGACRALPEVTRALRALGSRRGVRGSRRNPSDREGRFFAPFISARRTSMEVRDPASVIGAFEARGLAAAMAGTIVSFSDELSAGHPARRRAMEAELSDAADHLSAALTALEDLAARALDDVDNLVRWRLWAAGVQRVFEAADRAWIDIEIVVSR